MVRVKRWLQLLKMVGVSLVIYIPWCSFLAVVVLQVVAQVWKDSEFAVYIILTHFGKIISVKKSGLVLANLLKK